MATTLTPQIIHRPEPGPGGSPSKALVRWIDRPGHPVPLAVARIVVFLLLIDASSLDLAVRMAGLPGELVFPPEGLGWAKGIVPLDPTAVRLVGAVFLVTCWLAVVGLFTKQASWIAAISSVYVVGVPQFYGKVDHPHFLIWFALILAASPSGDVLSLDAVRRGLHGGHLPLEPEARYGRPIRAMWLLFGVVYFFPGLVKLATGWRWVFGDNLRYIMWAKWFQLDLTDLPTPRIDQWPGPVLWMLAAGTIAFELGFIVAILRRGSRRVAILTGIVFHALNARFLRIFFRHLMIAYLVFVPWERVFSRIGRLLFRTRIEYHCVAGSRDALLARAMQAVDLLRRVEWIEHPSIGPEAAAPNPGLGSLLARVPLGVVVLALRPVLERVPNRKPARRPARLQSGVIATVLAGSVIAGATVADSAWPFAAYPSFGGLNSPWVVAIDVAVQYGDGTSREVDIPGELGWLPRTKYDGMRRHILEERDGGRQREQLSALWGLVADANPDIAEGAEGLRFSAAFYSSDPARRGEAPFRVVDLGTIEVSVD